jgi:anthranilate synthase
MTNSENAERYVTRGGIQVECVSQEVPLAGAVDELVRRLDAERGVVLASRYEYPGRYTKWDFGFVNPPLVLVARGRELTLEALNARGRALLPILADALRALPALESIDPGDGRLSARVHAPAGRFPEEERSRQPSVFSVIRALVDFLGSDRDPHLGLYGAFGYDLAFQFEPLRLRHARPPAQRDLVLYLPDELLVVDHQKGSAVRHRYDFAAGSARTHGLAREGARAPYTAASAVPRASDHAPGEYAGQVRKAREAFARGDLFEVVPSQTFFEPCADPPSEVFARLIERNPAPYGFLLNLGEDEYLVGASPEMYVRVEGDRVETCPIAGTIARGADALGDASRILELLSSTKEESELTMCTDVDRNDKARICRPGTVRVIGRRQIEIYSRLIHTVDHVEGRLREGLDGLDAFLTHTWAVTVTGAPKAWAMQFIEDHERSPRAWYGGAVGRIGFDGHLNTGLTLRTIRLVAGVAEVRVGATLLYDSDPEAEERETQVKASALLDAIRRPRGVALPERAPVPRTGAGRRVLLVDHQDSFVLTLADYFRQTGAAVTTLRAGFPDSELDRLAPDLVVLSPGPGRPEDFALARTIGALLERRLPIFGVCLGLQGLVEYYGGKLEVLSYPMHGKPSTIRVRGGRIFEGLPRTFQAGRYHSLYARSGSLPSELVQTAEADDGIVMALEHPALPVAAVQFHPESIMTLEGDLGLRLVANVVRVLARG